MAQGATGVRKQDLTVRKFFLHLKSPDAIDRDDIGLACEDLEHAYLQACEAIPDVAAEILRNRRDPMKYSFLIENEAGERLMTVPFSELVQEKPECPQGEGELEIAHRHVRQGIERLRRQGELVARMRASGFSTKTSESLYRLFGEVLQQHRLFLDRILARQSLGTGRASRQNLPHGSR